MEVTCEMPDLYKAEQATRITMFWLCLLVVLC